MGQTNRRKLGELLDNVQGNTGSTTTVTTGNTDYDTNWNPVNDSQLFQSVVQAADLLTVDLHPPITDPWRIGRIAAILQRFIAPDETPMNNQIRVSEATSTGQRFVLQSGDSQYLDQPKFYASVLESAGIPWVLSEIHLNFEDKFPTGVQPIIQAGVSTDPGAENEFKTGVKDEVQHQWQRDDADMISSTVGKQGYKFYPLGSGDFMPHVRTPGTLYEDSFTEDNDLRNYVHKGIIKSSF